MNPDWRSLAPHVPLGQGDPTYVPRKTGGAQSIAAWVEAGGSTVLVGGPAGIGKSTELAQAASLLSPSRIACFVPLDRWENMRALTPERLLLRIAGIVAKHAMWELKLPVSRQVRAGLYNAGALDFDEAAGKEHSLERYEASPRAIAHQTLLEVTRLSQRGRLTLLLDGLEKIPPGTAPQVFDSLGELPEEIEIVAVIPWHAAFGPQAEVVIRPGERLEMIRPLEVDGAAGREGRQFLCEILARRPEIFPQTLNVSVMMQAAEWSGGLPRIFLQLMADAGTYAKMRRDEPWPDERDLAEAIADRKDSFRRLLLPGDAAAIQRAAGTDGRELKLERKVRLMAHGILLEHLRAGMTVIDPHPLIREALEASAHA